MKKRKPLTPAVQKQQKTKHGIQYSFKPNIWFAVISACIGIVLYLNTVNHDFILDDGAVINEYVMQGIKGIPKILQTELFHFENIHLGYYRPLSMITFAIENQFFGNNPHIYHLGNVILYGLTGFFLCLFIMIFFKNFHPAFAFIITLLFISHPIHTEVVANIKSRDEILSFLNLTISFIFLLKAYEYPLRNTKYLIFSLFFFYLALLSKETAMVGLIVIPLILFYRKNNSIKQCLLYAIPFLIILLLFQWQKYLMIGALKTDLSGDIVNYPYALNNVALPTAFVIFLWYIKLIVIPHPLSYDYSYNQIPAVHFSSPIVWLGIISVIMIVALGLISFKKKLPLSFGVLFFLITLAPALGFVYLRGGILAERFLYAPALGFCIILVLLILKITKVNLQTSEFSIRQLKTYPIFICISLLGLYSFKTISRNFYWKNIIVLAGEDVKVSANSCQLRKHYGNELINLASEEKNQSKKKELFDEGIKQLRESIKINPHNADVFFKIGFAYQVVEENNDSAINYYNYTIQTSPGYAIAYNNMGLLYEKMSKEDMASYFYNKSIESNPSLAEGIHNHERHKQRTGLDVHIFPSQLDIDAIEKNSANKDASFYYNLGIKYALQGDYAGGIKCFEKAIRLDPNQESIYINLSNCYGMLGKYNENIETLNKLLKINPKSAQAYSNLAITYDLIGDKGKAKEYKNKASELSNK